MGLLNIPTTVPSTVRGNAIFTKFTNALLISVFYDAVLFLLPFESILCGLYMLSCQYPVAPAPVSEYFETVNI